MKSEPFISVVVPTYNRAHLITPTLESLLQQDYTHYEVIVVDDGSTDNTEEVVQAIQDERLRYFKKDNAERAAARNYGALRAKGDYINFFDSDDIALPNHLSEAAEMIINKDTPEWFHLGYAWVTVEGQIFKTVDNFTGDTLQTYIPYGNPLSCNGVFIRNDIIKSHPFNEERLLSASEDYELWYRLAARYPLYYSNTVTSHIIDHEARSVRTINFEKTLSRLNLLIELISKDSEIQKVFSDKLFCTKAEVYAYFSLHLSESPQLKINALKYFLKSIVASRCGLFKRRSLAIVRNLLVTW